MDSQWFDYIWIHDQVDLSSTFSLVLLGQFILAVGQALVLTSITEIVSRWFPPIRERGMAVGITSASQYLSLAVVMIVSPPILVVTKANDPAWGGSGFEELMRFYAILSSTLALAAALLVRENPPSPSSALPSNNKVHYRSSFRGINAISSLRADDYFCNWLGGCFDDLVHQD